MSTDPVANSTLYAGQNQGRPGLYAGTNPRSATLASLPNSVNQTLGFQSNYTVPYHYRIARWAGGYDKSLKNGQIAFIRHTKGGPPTRRQHHVQETMMNLPMVNYALYRDALKRTQAGEAADDADVVDDILNTFMCMGTIINEGAPFAVDEGRGMGNTQARLINLCVRGRQNTFNVWGDIRDGDELFLKLCKENVSGTSFELDVHTNHSSMPETQEIACYQFVPTYKRYHKWNASEFVTGKSATTKDQHAVHFINLGRCFRTQRHQKHQLTDEERARRTRSVSNMVSMCPQFEILVDPVVM